MFKKNIETKNQEQETKKGTGLRNLAIFFGGFAAGAGTVYGAMKYVEHNRAIDDLLDNGVVDSDEDYPVEPDDPQGPVDGSGSTTEENDRKEEENDDTVVSDSSDREEPHEEDSQPGHDVELKSFEEELAATQEMVNIEEPDPAQEDAWDYLNTYILDDTQEFLLKIGNTIGLKVVSIGGMDLSPAMNPVRIKVTGKPFAPAKDALPKYSDAIEKLSSLTYPSEYGDEEYLKEMHPSVLAFKAKLFTELVRHTHGFFGISFVLDPVKLVSKLKELDEVAALPNEIVDNPEVGEAEKLPEEIVDEPVDGVEDLPDEIVDDPIEESEEAPAPAPEVEFTTRMHAVIDDIEKVANEKKFVEAKKLYRSTLLPMVNELDHLDEKLAPLRNVIENVGTRLTEKMMEERDKAVEASKSSEQKYPAKKGGKKNRRNKKSQSVEEPVVVPQMQTMTH